ncbi:SusD/RagB family nutrient-binding outer membrane lipoprotein [Dysgonomonas sp. 520]|uniref:SusD/RagB family nutrient-binding outer membrane lipoprotein n=1 Tax=Dysgonomonas sp. 520 TaxID=2302931 RepID=UPI0013D0FE1E|nr:SusD/RagB family nutrient-binding outer membrane lipoprotein [Dysgonomonas sp. 520]NDW10358.1 SusD/RagB family nutrient-binding outer membrane lipoprotein [Dysgonomonas sp. 520]
MNKIFYIALAVLSSCFFMSCDDFLDINDNPNTTTTVTPDQSLPVILFYGAQLVYDHAEYNVYLAQALTTGGRSQTGTYPYKQGWEFLSVNRHPQWRRHYYDIGTNLNEMEKAAEAIGAKNCVLIGRTIRLMSTLYTTDAFGDMPLSQAYKSNAPKYDTQEEVYRWMYDEVEQLLKDYDDPNWNNNSKNIRITESIDRIYGGDLEKWKHFTYGLKARIYLRNLPNWNNTNEFCDSIIIAANKALDGWVEPNYKYSGGTQLERNCPWGPKRPIINSWESRSNELQNAIPSKFFVETILGYPAKRSQYGVADDPRMVRLMKEAPGPKDSDDQDTKYRYLENNIGMDASYKQVNYPNMYLTNESPDRYGVFTSNDSYISLMLTEELLLIKAEAQYWRGQKEEAYKTTYEAAEMNMKRHECRSTHVTMYLKREEYLPQAGFNIGHLMRQKYVCMYLQPEIWTDMRRYKYSGSKVKDGEEKVKYDGVEIYPNLRRPYNLYEPYWGNNVEWVQRLNYDPETEDVYNKAELERLGAYQNPNWLKKTMIWAE